MKTDRDIVDEIDELVDWQMQKERSGYDHNVNQRACPHDWCFEEFHTLPIKQRMREIRRKWHAAITYFEGGETVSGEAAAELDAYRYNEDDSPVLCPGSLFEGDFEPPEEPANYRTAITAGLSWPNPFLPDIRGDVDRITEPLRELQQSPVRTIIDMDTVRAIRRLYCRAPLVYGHPPEAEEYIERAIAAQVVDEVWQRFPGVSISAEDVQIVRQQEIAVGERGTVLEGQWRPATNEIEMHGGHANGQTFTVGFIDSQDFIYSIPPVRLTFADFADSAPVVMPTPVQYYKAGWNTATRRWVYRCEEPETEPEPPVVQQQSSRRASGGVVSFAPVGTPLDASEGWQRLGTVEPGSIQFRPVVDESGDA